MRNNERCAALILTHGRPSHVYTYDTLRKCGYTGDIYIIIDNEDEKGDEYRKRFGSKWVIEFDKLAVSKTFDTGDTQNDRRSIVYARNASFSIAAELGLDYFVQLDDDYTAFHHRYPSEGVLKYHNVENLDAVFEAMLDFLDTTNAATVAFAQGGDLLGGVDSRAVRDGILRKAMNSLFVKTSKPVQFIGRINEDVNTYVVGGQRGQLFLTVGPLALCQMTTQTNAGGMTSLYTESGTYLKSMFTVMMAPSCTSIGLMGSSNMRLHHRIKHEHAYPKVISSRYLNGAA